MCKVNVEILFMIDETTKNYIEMIKYDTEIAETGILIPRLLRIITPPGRV